MPKALPPVVAALLATVAPPTAAVPPVALVFESLSPELLEQPAKTMSAKRALLLMNRGRVRIGVLLTTVT